MSTPRSGRAQASLQEHPWALALVSGLFVAGIVLLASDAGWDLTADVGGSRRHAPLWLVLLLGVPLFGAGVVLGVVQQIRLLIRPPAPPPPSAPDPDGPGWLSRGSGEDDPRA